MFSKEACSFVIMLTMFPHASVYVTIAINLELSNCVQIELLVFESNTWNHLMVGKQISNIR